MAIQKTKLDFFICDHCGNRRRLASAKRHWCDLCTHIAPVEMRLTREKRLTFTPPAENQSAASSYTAR